MLVDPIFLPVNLNDDFIYSIYGLDVDPNEIRNRFVPKRIEKGYYTYATPNFHIRISDGKGKIMRFPYVESLPLGIPKYGICKSPQEFITKYGSSLESLPGKYVVSFWIVDLDAEEFYDFNPRKWGEPIDKTKPLSGVVYTFNVLEFPKS